MSSIFLIIITTYGGLTKILGKSNLKSYDKKTLFATCMLTVASYVFNFCFSALGVC